MSAALEPAAACPSCGSRRAGAWCAGCGQRFRDGRLTVWGVVQQVVGELVTLDRGVLNTARAALVAPGRLAADFVAGRTAPYVGPVKYYLLIVGAAQLVALRTGFLQDVVSGFFDGADGTVAADDVQSQARTLAFARDYFVSLTALAIPFYAAWTRALFRRAGRNYAEHLVLALYTGAQLVAALVAWAAVVGLARRTFGPGFKPLEGIFYLLASVYQTAALACFTGVRWPGSAWRMVLAGVLAFVCWVALLVIALTASRHW